MCFHCYPAFDRIKRFTQQTESKWSPRAEAALTRFMLSMPTGGYKFEVIAGTPVKAAAPDSSVVATMRSRIERRKARHAAKMRRLRQAETVSVTSV
jgi:hypothetical protein